MVRKPRDYDAELKALIERTRKIKTQKTTQLGELVQLTGADILPIEAIVGALLTALEDASKTPEAVARWTERGQTFFQQSGKRSKKPKARDAAPRPASHIEESPAADRAA